MRLLYIILLLLAPIAAYAQQQGTPKPSGNEASGKQQPPSQASKMIAIQNFGATNNKSEAAKKQTSPPPESKSFLTHGETVNAAIALLVLLVSIFGWGAVYRQANLMERTLRLQEGALRQWLNTDAWHVDMDEFGSLIISFDAINRTSIPLWLDIVKIEIAGGQQSGTKGVANWLVPNTPFTVILAIPSIQQQSDDFETAKLQLLMYVSIFFRDALNKHWRQEIQFVLISKLGGDIVSEFRTLLFDSTPPPE